MTKGVSSFISLSLCLLAIHIGTSVSVVLQNPSQLSSRASFDFIVVGSGPGGATVASRLSENHRFNVLLIEAGTDNEGVLDLQVPGFMLQIPKTYEWNTTTAPIASLGGRSIDFQRGHVLGGGSSVNGMAYTRGAADDYNRWARLTGDDGWRWNNLWKYIRKNERFTTAPNSRNVTGEFNPEFHGYSGTLQVSVQGAPHTLLDRLALESVQAQNEFSFNRDYNSGRPIGLGFLQTTIGNGERSSAATGYLNASVRARPNLTILLNTFVTRVLSAGRESKTNRINSIEIGNRAERRILRTITANNEVILSAGVLGSPQILLNSGIGDTRELNALGIRTIHNLPDVGRNFADHVNLAVTYLPTANATPPIDPVSAMQQWTTSRSGPFIGQVFNANHLLLARIPSNSSVWNGRQDPSSGSYTPHIEHIPMELAYPGLSMIGGLAVLLQPTSVGSVKLRSKSPFDEIILQPGYLQSQLDLDVLAEGIRLVKRFTSTPGWANVLGAPTYPDPDVLPRNEWVVAVRQQASAGLHGVGTASMSPRSSRDGVVTPDLKVKGLEGLRVVDASVIPKPSSGHTQVPVYILAERAAELIAEDWSRGR
ncbi:aryl-alcohol oxidase [Coprinopsis marcescibilis]|uniref:pyranose dehydrogenase (acceptor) n=1 Tax=Coprinopsis marcescibilis TaxID=230819 RepID=A0A5C3KJK3_COPMA|nr:aryl-alcohol oxidase [Coprinopsis marcescibilis]